MSLHPQSQAFLDAVAANSRPGWDEMPTQQSRDIFSAMTDLFETGPELSRVENLITENNVRLRIYQAERSHEATPAVLYFHGGGWVLGDLGSHDTLCRRLAAESGLIVVSVDYRRAPEHVYPAALEDCLDAAAFITEHCEELGVEGAQLIVAGDSAGGNLAAAVSLRTRDAANDAAPSPIIGQLLIYPALSADFDSESYTKFAEGFGLTRQIMIWFWEQYLGLQTADQFAAPALAKSLTGLPPTHVITAEYDILRDEGEAFAERLMAAGVPTTQIRYDGMLHAFMHFTGAIGAGREAVSETAEVLRNFCGR